MIESLLNNFPAGKNYLVCQEYSEQINSFLFEKLVSPFQHRHRQNLWGSAAKNLPLLGRNIGWIPNKIPATFLSETVESEIAEACSVQENILQPEKKHFIATRKLLDQFNLTELSGRNPFFLSEGETKMVWFFTQWMKQPDYLIIGYLPSGLSKPRIQNVLDFFVEQEEESTRHPVIILGYIAHQRDWCASLLEQKNWENISHCPKL